MIDWFQSIKKRKAGIIKQTKLLVQPKARRNRYVTVQHWFATVLSTTKNHYKEAKANYEKNNRKNILL